MFTVVNFVEIVGHIKTVICELGYQNKQKCYAKILEKAQFRYGKYLLRDRHPVLQKYLCRERNRLEKLEQELSEVNSSRARIRLELVYEEKKCLEEAWETYGFGM